jgi:hypothetical protein
MTKRFCDLCGHPAADGTHGAETSVDYGKPYEGVHRGGAGFETRQPRIVASVHFSFRDHPTGFGGPPDLCAECAANLVSEVRARVSEKKS